MLDPVSVELYRGMQNVGETAVFTMNVNVDTGGNFFRGGENVFDANGGSTVNFEAGTTLFTADFSFSTTDRNVRL